MFTKAVTENEGVCNRQKMKWFAFEIARVTEEWADQTIGGGWRAPCIEMGCSELTRAESPEGTSIVAESSPVT